MSKEKFAEKLVLLDDFGRGLKARMHQMKKRFSSPTLKPAFLNDQGLKKVLDAFVKAFPSEPSGVDKIAGFDQLTLKNKDIMAELEPYYGLIGDVLDFKDHAFHLLNDLNSNVIGFKWDVNPSLMAGYLNLFVNYIKILLMLGSIDDRKLVVSLYARCFQQQNSGQEPNLAKLRLFVAEYENPFKTIQNEFSSLGSRIGDTLQGLAVIYAKIRDLPILRRDGLFNIIQNSSILPYALTDPTWQELMKSSMFQEWLLYGCLFCPNELSSNVLLDSLKSLLQDTWVTLIYRDEFYLPHEQFDNLFSWFKGSNKEISKVKKIPGEMITNAITKAGASHHEWRTVLKQEIANLYNLLSDKPGLIAPKLPMIFAVLNNGVTEVRWHFLHTDKTPPKKTKYREEDYSDPTVAELMYQITKLHGLVNLHAATIKRFYSEFLKGSDLKSLESIVSDLSSAGKLTDQTKGYLDAIIGELQSFDPAGAKVDFAALRLNWMRCEAQLSVIGTTHSIHNMKDLSYRMSLVYFHTRCVDKLQELNDEHGSMRSLWWHHEPLLQLFQQVIQSPTLAYTWTAFIYICNQFSDNAHRMLPAERLGLGKAAVETAQKLTIAVSNTITNYVGKLHSIYQELYMQTAASRAAVPTQKKEKKNTSKQPGVESHFTNQSMIAGLDGCVAVMNQLAAGMAEMRPGVVIFSIKLYPVEFLVEDVTNLIKKRVKAFCRTDDNIERPTSLVSQFASLNQALSLLTASTDIDIPHIMHDIMYDNVVTTSIQDGCLLSWARGWYTNYIFKRLVTVKNVYYSPLHKRYYCDATAGLKPAPEDFIEMDEMRALVTLLGPIGMKTFHQDIVKQLSEYADVMKKFLITNQHTLSELRNGYLKEDATTEALKKLKGVDEFCQAAIQYGSGLVIRSMISEATRDVLNHTTPLLVNAVEVAYQLYPMNTYGYYDFVDTDIMAGDLGVPLGASDPMLSKAMAAFNSSTVDMAVWDLLPYAFAATFTSIYWRDASYIVWAETFNNNLLMLCNTISTLIITMQSISAKIHKDAAQLMANDKLVKDSLTRFIDIASVMVLRTQQKNAKDVTVHLQLMFLDKFIDNCEPFLRRDVLDSRIPYGLIRYAYSVILRQDEAESAARKIVPEQAQNDKKDNRKEEESNL